MEDIAISGGMMAAIAVGLALCMLPGIIAQGRGHRDAWAIWMLSVLLGWTVIGWVGAFIWAVAGSEPRRRLDPALRSRLRSAYPHHRSEKREMRADRAARRMGRARQ
jgi:hypothetical protein